MEEDAESVKLTLKGNKWLKQKESPFVTLAQEGIRAEELLGEGAFAKVVSAYHEKLKRKVAVKITDKRKAPAEYLEKFLQREINAICDLDHPNIVKLLGIYESTDRIFMVMELCEGGDLLDYVNEQKYRSEMEIKRHFQELSLAIYHTHQRGVVHRDLKLENLILDLQGNLKVTDFGFARHSVKGNLLDTCCGSFAYACPEVLRGEAYDGFASDVWSMGIILYAMFTCKLPYTEIDLKMLANGSSVQKLKFSQDTPRGARDLVRKMLECDPSERFTCEEIISHEWLRGENFPPERNFIIAGDALQRGCGSRISKTVNCKTASSVSSEISELSVESTLSVNGPILRNRDDLGIVISEKNPTVPGEEANFKVYAVRRSTITSADNQRLLTNIMQQPTTRFSKTVKKKKVALMCLGGLGKKAKDSDVSGTIKFQDSGRKKENLYDIVSQVTKAKTEKGKTENHLSDDEFEQEDSDEECIKQMRRELECLENDGLSLEAREGSQAPVVEEKKKLRSWRKVCGRLTSKGS